MAVFAPSFPAIIVTDAKNRRYGVIGDLHLGLETSYLRSSTSFSSSLSKDIIKSVWRLIERYALKRLIILGDVKHSIIEPSSEEKILIRNLFNGLMKRDLEVVMVKGNHDPRIQNYVRRTSNIHLSSEPYVEIRTFDKKRVVIAHGHRKLPSFLKTPNCLIVGHLHPCIKLISNTGETSILRVFLEFEALANTSQQRTNIWILPAFNPLGCYLFLHGELKRRLAILRDYEFQEEKVRVFDLANNFLGDLKFLREEG